MKDDGDVDKSQEDSWWLKANSLENRGCLSGCMQQLHGEGPGWVSSSNGTLIIEFTNVP
jgi:hypothetical protein